MILDKYQDNKKMLKSIYLQKSDICSKFKIATAIHIINDLFRYLRHPFPIGSTSHSERIKSVIKF